MNKLLLIGMLYMASNALGNHCVTVILEAKPGKEQQLKKELVDVMNHSKKESTCLSYKVHQDISVPTKFSLYEVWTSPQDHAKQFEKPYIIELIKKLEDLLACEYQIVMGNSIE